GMVSLPYLTKIPAAGLTCRQLANKVKPLLEKEFYKQATVLIALDTNRKFRGKVYIFGAVNQPGSIQIPTNEVFTVSKAILKVGGFAPSADRTSVRVERRHTQGKKTMNVNMADIIDGGNTDGDIVLEPNDFIVIPNQASKGRVFVTGQVLRPGPIPMPAENPLTVSEAILAAGGFQEFADKGKVRVIRKVGQNVSDTKEIIVNVAAVLDKGRVEEDFELQADDRVVVRARWINF
ncbi:MAG: SLBB domain-containing protein, partial [Verrucomicrobiota bacterium]